MSSIINKKPKQKSVSVCCVTPPPAGRFALQLCPLRFRPISLLPSSVCRPFSALQEFVPSAPHYTAISRAFFLPGPLPFLTKRKGFPDKKLPCREKGTGRVAMSAIFPIPKADKGKERRRKEISAVAGGSPDGNKRASLRLTYYGNIRGVAAFDRWRGGAQTCGCFVGNSFGCRRMIA